MTTITFEQSETPGPPGLNPQGNWISSKTYLTRDLVAYNGSGWAALKINQNVEPSDANSTTWMLVVRKGADGELIGTIDNISGFGNYGKTIAKFSTLSEARQALGIGDFAGSEIDLGTF